MASYVDIKNKLKIEEYVTSNKIKLLCQIPVIDSQFEILVNDLKFKVNHLSLQKKPSADLITSLALVQIAIRYYQEGNFWRNFNRAINLEVSSTKQNYLGKIFLETICYYNMYDFRGLSGAVEKIKAHAFVMDYYLKGFFDFAYAYYENNLFRNLSDDIDLELQSLSSFIKDSVDNDVIVSGNSHTAKTYKLLKSTKHVFAFCDFSMIKSLFFPVLQWIDDFYYDNKIPSVSGNRMEWEFSKWCERINETKSHTRSTTKSRNYFRRPYLKVNVDQETASIVIPPQKFRKEDFCDTIRVTIESGDDTIAVEMNLYLSFGEYVSEEMRIPIKDIFADYEIVFGIKNEKSYSINQSNYRILNAHSESINRFCKGINALLVKRGINVKWESKTDVLDFYDGYLKWQFYSAEISENSICTVGSRMLTLVGEVSGEPVYDYPIRYFTVYDENGMKLTATRTHPEISFTVKRVKYPGTVLDINGKRYALKDIESLESVQHPQKADSLLVDVRLGELLAREDGRYQVKLDVPGEQRKTICEYCLLKRVRLSFDKPRYVYCREARLTVFRDGYEVLLDDSACRLDYQDEKSVDYQITLSADLEALNLKLIGDEDIYVLSVPIKLFKFGFSGSDFKITKEKIWYSHLRNLLYLILPGAQEVRVCLEHSDIRVECERLEKDLFRADISEIIRYIQNGNSIFYSIVIEYFDNKLRKLSLPEIIRRLYIEPYFILSYRDHQIDLNINRLDGEAELYLDVTTSDTGEMLVQRKRIRQGENILPELKPNTYYHLAPYTEEPDEFGFDTTVTKLKEKTGIAYDYLDLTNMSIMIHKVTFRKKTLLLKSLYFVSVNERIDQNQYIGYMYGKERETKQKHHLGKVLIKVKKVSEWISFSILCYSDEECVGYDPYYDIRFQRIIRHDNPYLNRSRDYKAFCELSAEDTEFFADIKKMRRY